MSETSLFALVGENIGYSLSPKIFGAIFKSCGLDGRFELCSVDRDRLGSAVVELVERNVRGFSVTIPHKRAIIDHLDELDPVAERLGAVNSVAVIDGRLTGHNTDVDGVDYTLAQESLLYRERPALILGTGGSARAVVYALYHRLGVRSFEVYGRSETGRKQFADDAAQAIPEARLAMLDVVPRPDDLGESPSLMINCTPLGSANHTDALPYLDDTGWSGLPLYFDLNYNEGNRAMAYMADQGVMVVDGRAMLVAQAVKSFELWTGKVVAVDPVLEEVFGRSG